ncbi:hypothetical protein QYE76_066029 [Lolium multiflorum]|uniref:Major facilitator superfamily (MFS) profile domain-containing protein n=1 Tax=Lolium multiflorum TaxID=4521 RepID=A0AAD8SA09_LOLMU|nr:hypothetical protein QYE76_066029 [Lolium multiflorum]
MLWSPNIYTLLLARLIVGSGSGLVFTCVPIYISETSSPDMRGSLGTTQFMFIVGIIFSYCMVFWMTLVSSYNWRVMVGSIFAPSIVYFALLVFYLPESPRWLVSDGKISEARISLQWLRGKDDVSGEISLIVDGINIIPGMGIGGNASSNAQGQSFVRTSTSQFSRYSSLYWHLSDPLVDLLGSIHENMSETGGVRNNFFPAFHSFNFVELERMDEYREEDDSVQQNREAYPGDEGNNGHGLQASLLSQGATAEEYDTNAPFTSEGSSSYLRRHGTTGLVQEFAASLQDHDIEEKKSMKQHYFLISLHIMMWKAQGYIHRDNKLSDYARVGVDEVLKGYETLELDIPAGEGETTLGRMVSFYGKRKTPCFQTRRQGHRLLRVTIHLYLHPTREGP